MSQLTLRESLRVLAREAADISETVARDHGMNVLQYTVLGAVADHGPITAYEVSRRIWVADGSVVHAAAMLRGRNYITRDENGPAPSKPLMITQSGLKILADCTKAMEAVDLHMAKFINTITREGIAEAHTKMRKWYDIPAA